MSHSEYTSKSFDEGCVSALTHVVKLLACGGYHVSCTVCEITCGSENLCSRMKKASAAQMSRS